MSASPSPNSGYPTKNPNVPKASTLSRHGGKILGTGLAVGLTYAYFVMKPPRPDGSEASVNPFRTQGVENIEKAYQRGGATSTHTKAYGGTTQGQTDDVLRQWKGAQSGTGKEKGFSEEHMGDEQRGKAKNIVGDKFQEMKYGDSKGK